MKILHISTSDNGGAGLAALRIHKTLLSLGYESKMLVVYKSSQLDSVYEAKKNLNLYHWSSIWIFRKFQKHILRRLGKITSIEKFEAIINSIPEHQRAFFTFPVTQYDISKHPLVIEADIIHLHWIANFVDYGTFFKNVKKPIVWTFHDENIGLGGFHYISTKQKYDTYYKDIEERFCKIKRQALRERNDITCIALSKKMAEFCTNNSFLKQNQVVIIHNMVDNSIYKPQNKRFARQVFNIPEKDKVFIFSSLNINDERKGFHELQKSLEILNLPNVTLLCIGDGSIPNIRGVNTICVGQIKNENVMSLLYSCGDLLIMPSFQEAFAQTPLEAISCGIPVVSFPCSGAEDLINENNGIISTDFTIEALVESIQKALNRKYNPDIIRQDVIIRFSTKKIANDYITVYNTILR